MRFTLVMFLLLIAASAGATDKLEGRLYDSGSDFLRLCDEESSYRKGLPAAANVTAGLICDYWLMGLKQGVQAEDNLRPKHTPTKEEGARDRAAADALIKAGVRPVFEMPDRDLCLPEGVTMQQVRLVVIKYMKDHPGTLNLPTYYLAIAAMKNEWPCS